VQCVIEVVSRETGTILGWCLLILRVSSAEMGRCCWASSMALTLGSTIRDCWRTDCSSRSRSDCWSARFAPEPRSRLAEDLVAQAHSTDHLDRSTGHTQTAIRCTCSSY